MNNTSPIHVSLEFTPNPNTLKYSVNRTLLDSGAMSFLKPTDAVGKSELVSRLFEIPGICGVMVGKDFVTVTKTDTGDWDVVHKSTSDTLEKYLDAGLPVFAAGALESMRQKGGDSEVEQKIREILDREIRPAVAMDGGDIAFERYEDGIVYLFMQGSCAGCPSATMTLKHGIETRLKEAIPEIIEVVSV